MEKLTHVYYDQVGQQIVLFEANLESKYKFIYWNKELEVGFKDIEEKIPNREHYIYLGSLED